MKKILCLLCVLVTLFLVTGCDMVLPHPESGIWYCEELNITLDLERRTAAYQIESGAYKTARIGFSPPGVFKIFLENGSGGERDILLQGDYEYEDKVFHVTDFETNTTYTFVLTVDR